jgi:RND superfamily putative drug exporter
MLERVASLTWRRPKVVLACVAAVVVAAAGFGHDVEHHLKAAGFTDSTSESERATAASLEAFGYDPNPGIMVLVRARDGGRLDLSSPAVRREVHRLSKQLGKARHVGRVVDPLAAGRQGRLLVAKDGRSLVIAGHLTIQDVEDAGCETSEDAKRLVRSTTLATAVGGFAASFQEVNDQTRSDLTKAELIAFPALAFLLLLVFAG